MKCKIKKAENEQSNLSMKISTLASYLMWTPATILCCKQIWHENCLVWTPACFSIHNRAAQVHLSKANMQICLREFEVHANFVSAHIANEKRWSGPCESEIHVR